MGTYGISSNNHYHGAGSRYPARIPGAMEVCLHDTTSTSLLEEGLKRTSSTDNDFSPPTLLHIMWISMTTMLDYQLTLRYLAYLGFEGDTTTAIKVTRPRKIDRRKGKVQRNVFLCYVFGAPKCGKVSKDKTHAILSTHARACLDRNGTWKPSKNNVEKSTESTCYYYY